MERTGKVAGLAEADWLRFGLEVGVMGGNKVRVRLGARSKTSLGRKRTANWVGSRTLLPTVGLAFLAACTNHPDEGTPVKPGTGVTRVPGGGQKVMAAPARPIMGGTLATSHDGTIAIASDPDRDAVFVVDLARRAVTPIELEAGEVPGRIVMGSGANAYVVLRDAGAVARIDLDRKELVARYEVCGAPRGIAFDAGTQLLHVACQSGELVSLDAESGEVERRVRVADDLRDVVPSGDHLVLTTFRSSEILVVNASGEVERRTAPSVLSPTSQPSVAWRAAAGPDGRVQVIHQLAEVSGGISTTANGYGEGGGDPTCSSSIVSPAVTTVDLSAQEEEIVSTPLQLLGAAGPTDIAISAAGRIAIVVAGNTWSDAPAVRTFESAEVMGSCAPSFDPDTEGEPVAVAFADERTIVQSREPAALYLEDGDSITLSTESHANTGLGLFHMNTGAGIACASCHPEGTEDGQIWIFAELGPRRTQNVAGGIAARAPYHWDGDMEDFTMLVDEVMVGRMSLPDRPNVAQLEGFLGWVDSVERPDARFGDPEAVARGEALFMDPEVGCNDCHTGPELTNKRAFDVGTLGTFVVPSLKGIAARAPYLHDGCAKTLRDRFNEGCGGGDRHGQTSQLNEGELGDLVTYLETL